MRALLIAVAVLGLAGCSDFRSGEEEPEGGEDEEEAALKLDRPANPAALA